MIENTTLKELKHFCQKQKICKYCPYYEDYSDAYDLDNKPLGFCIFKNHTPAHWNIKENN